MDLAKSILSISMAHHGVLILKMSDCMPGKKQMIYYKNILKIFFRIVIQTLINKLRNIGWKLLISADVSAKCVQTKDAQYQLGIF